MRFKLKYIGFLGLIFLFSACLMSVKNDIKSLERDEEKCKIIKFIDVSAPLPFYGKDSLLILKQQYDSLYSLKISEIAEQISLAKNDFESAKLEFSEIENPMLKKAYGNGLNNLEYKYQKLLKIDSIYKNVPKQTFFGEILGEIKVYSQKSNSKLGEIITVYFMGKQGNLDVQMYKKSYFKNSKGLFSISN